MFENLSSCLEKKGNAQHITPKTEFKNNRSIILKSEADIMARWKTTTPLVSICCITYNHEKYIAKTIESFLMQKTDFPFEIVIGEDCSTDNTWHIIKSYQEKYPSILKLLPNDKNLGSFNNFKRAHAYCCGEFIAYCEGDDYWTDIFKLQKQVGFLLQNSDYVITYSSAHAVDDHQSIDYNYIGGISVDIDAHVLQCAAPINTLTVCYRKVLDDYPIYANLSDVIDLFNWSLLGHYGKGKYLASVLPSIYRQHQGGVHSQKGWGDKFKMLAMTDYALYLYYSSINHFQLSQYFLNKVPQDALKMFQVVGLEKTKEMLNDLITTMTSRAGLLEISNYDQQHLQTLLSLQNLQQIANQLIAQHNK